jgi:hypothetical protein
MKTRVSNLATTQADEGVALSINAYARHECTKGHHESVHNGPGALGNI